MSRLRIEKDGTALDLYPGTAFQIDMRSPVYMGDRSPESIPNIKTYQIRVPDTPKNRLLLDKPDALDNADDLHDEAGWHVYFDDKLFLSGRAKVTEARLENGYDFQFIGGLAGNLADLKSQYLNEMDLGGDVSFVGTANVWASATMNGATLTSISHLFPPIWIGGTPWDFVNNFDTVTDLYDMASISTPVPMFKVRWILDQLLASVGFDVKGAFHSGAYASELELLLLFNNASMDRDDTNLGGSPITPKNHMPKVLASSLINNVTALFCMTPFLDERTKTLTIKANKDLLNAQRLDWSQKVERLFNVERRISAPDKLSYLDKIDETSQKEWFNPPSPYLGDTRYPTTSDLESGIGAASYVNHRIVTSMETYYRTTGDNGTSLIWEPFHQVLDPYNETGTNELSINAGTLYMRPRDTTESTSWHLTPQWKDGIKHPTTDVDIIDKIALLFWRGKHDDLSGDPRPIASNNIYDTEENAISGADHSLLWNRDNGLYTKWWKPWLDILNTSKAIKYNVRLNSTDLEQLDFSKKYLVNNHEHFLKRLQVTLTTNEIKTATVQMMIIQ
jgi:hypothetical protein